LYILRVVRRSLLTVAVLHIDLGSKLGMVVDRELCIVLVLHIKLDIKLGGGFPVVLYADIEIDHWDGQTLYCFES
jgi:hypothetical protein